MPVSFHYELWINMLWELFTQCRNFKNTKEYNYNYYMMQK